MSDYAAFLASKAPVPPVFGFDPDPMPGHMFDFQQAATRFAIKQGRSALFLDTGLGKTVCELEFAAQCAARTGLPSLILTPLAVAKQIEREAQRFGYDACVIREQLNDLPQIAICNYDRLDKLDAAKFGCVVLDESSVLKNYTGKTSQALIAKFADTQYRLCATATPAPNDHMELGQHASFLGIMASNEMLARWFTSDQTQMGRYRLKGHGVTAFWDWMASWAVMAESPEDLGFDGSRFVLPPMSVHRHPVAGDIRPAAGTLFAADVSATNMFAIKRETAQSRSRSVADLVNADTRPWLVWCDTDFESDSLSAAIPGAVEVRGSQSPETKEANIAAFIAGDARILITKPSICGAGLNLQHCANIAFVGRSFSYEDWYQAVRRCWRFGQTWPVHVHIMVAEGEDQIGRVIDRKADEHATMKRAMRDATRRRQGASSALKVPYDPQYAGRLPSWLSAA